MTKAKKNRKLVAQNKRNNFKNLFYTKKIKISIKKLQSNLKDYLSLINENEKELKILIIKKLLNSIYSLLDKSVKRNVIHFNSAARKKSTLGKLIFISLFKKEITKK